MDYLKNFLAKLALLPVLALLCGLFLIFFLFVPQFRLFKDKDPKHWRFYIQNTRGQHGYKKESNKDYEAFY